MELTWRVISGEVVGGERRKKYRELEEMVGIE